MTNMTFVQDSATPVQSSVMYFPQGNDVQVVARFPGIADGTGAQAEFYYKTDRTTPDSDGSTVVYTVSIVSDPDNAGATMSTFLIAAEDNSVAGALWWRIDVVDPTGYRSTVGFGTLMVEAV